MQKKIPVLEQVNTILIGIMVAAIVGYFGDLQKGDVRGFVESLLLTPVLAWAGNVMWLRYRASRNGKKAFAVSHPVKIGLKWGFLGVVVLFAYILVTQQTGMGGPRSAIGGIVVVFVLAGILAAQEAFRKGKQFVREER